MQRHRDRVVRLAAHRGRLQGQGLAKPMGENHLAMGLGQNRKIGAT